MMLFNKYEAMTAEAQIFCRAVEKALNPLIDDMQEMGASMRDVQYLIQSCVTAEIAVRVLKQGIALRKAEREAFNAHRPSETP